MKTYITRIPLLNLILGILLIALAIIAMFFTDLIESIVVYIIAFFIAAFSTFRFLKDYQKTDDKNASIILAAEYAIALGVAVYLAVYEANAARMVGLVLYMRGFAYLLTLQLLKIKGPFTSFLVYMAILTLGAFMLFAGSESETYMQYAVFGIIAIYGILLLVVGINGMKKKPSKEKSVKETKTGSTQ
ncbi:MAG: hypothetical protein ACLFUQ_02785 [Candidatus Izemoplasmataceae bacterium]